MLEQSAGHDFATITTVRHMLAQHGYVPIPCFDKRPRQDGWQKRQVPSRDEIELWAKIYHDARNTGVLTKHTPVIDIDVADRDLAAALEHLLADMFRDRGKFLTRIGNAPKRAIPFQTDVPFAKLTLNLIAPNGTTGQKIEVLGDGQQCIVAGVHPTTKQPYRWMHDALWTVERHELPLLRAEDVAEFFARARTEVITPAGWRVAEERTPRDSGAEGHSRGPEDWQYLFDSARAGRDLHKSLRDLAAKLVAAGMSDGAAGNLLRALMSTSAARQERQQDWQDRFDDIPRLVSTARETIDEAATAAVFDPWEPFIVPPFPIEILPPVVQGFVTTQSTVIGCCPSAMAMSALAAFSGALHHGFALKMMRHGAWYERPRLWVLLVADPSQLKTPTINAATAPLTHYETHLRVKYEADLRDYEMAKADAKIAGGASSLREPDPPPRYVVWDTTVEKLGELLARSDKGLLVKSDEISGWLGNMERYNAGRSDRAFWLSAYDGGPHSIDRIKRGEIYVKNLSVSLLGGIQPARLAEIQELTSDGLLQRFLPVMMSSASLPQDSLADDAEYRALVREMIFAKPARLIMSDGALAVMNDLRQHLFNLEQAAGGLAPGFQSFVGKLRGLAGSLALILHLAHDPQTGATYPVEEQTVENVRRLVLDFILPHAFEFYRGTSSTEGDRLRRLASWILTSGKPRVIASDLTTNVRDFRGLTLLQVNERVSPLVAAGWLAPEDKTPSCRRWTVTPQVHVQLAARARTEEARKAALASLMGSPRMSGNSTET